MDATFNQDFDCVCAIYGSRFAVFSLGALSGVNPAAALVGASGAVPLRRSLRSSAQLLHTPDNDSGDIGSTGNSGSDVYLVQMLHRTNLLAIVLKSDRCKLYLFDDIKNRAIVHLDFRHPVVAVRLRRDSIVILTTQKLYIYSLAAVPEKLYEVDATLPLSATDASTSHHTHFHYAVLSCSTAPHRAVVCLPARQKGHIQYIDYTSLTARHQPTSATSRSMQQQQQQQPREKDKRRVPDNGIFKAHDGEVRVVTVNADGTVAATASERGTLIRIWDITSGRLLNELRRGADSAEIYSIEFNRASTRIVVSSDKGTIHVFNVGHDDAASGQQTGTSGSATGIPRGASRRSSFTASGSSTPTLTASPTASSGSLPFMSNTKSSLSFLAPLIPLPSYFASEWSFASLKLTHRAHHHHYSAGSVAASGAAGGPGASTSTPGASGTSAAAANPTPTIGPATRRRTTSTSSSSSVSILSSSPLAAATSALMNASSSSAAAQQLANPIRAIAAFDGSDQVLVSTAPSLSAATHADLSATSSLASSASSSAVSSPLSSPQMTEPPPLQPVSTTAGSSSSNNNNNDKVVVVTDEGEVWKWSFDKWRGGEGVVDRVWKLSLDPDSVGVVEL
ncbi:Phosphatidylinositol 3,5-bisphosphate-binding protein [Sorochytrium milnesiophthora]